jgi:hypothetical protein
MVGSPYLEIERSLSVLGGKNRSHFKAFLQEIPTGQEQALQGLDRTHDGAAHHTIVFRDSQTISGLLAFISSAQYQHLIIPHPP